MDTFHAVAASSFYQSKVPLLSFFSNSLDNIQPAITCLKLTIETLEQGVKYVQN